MRGLSNLRQVAKILGKKDVFSLFLILQESFSKEKLLETFFLQPIYTNSHKYFTTFFFRLINLFV